MGLSGAAAGMALGKATLQLDTSPVVPAPPLHRATGALSPRQTRSQSTVKTSATATGTVTAPAPLLQAPPTFDDSDDDLSVGMIPAVATEEALKGQSNARMGVGLVRGPSENIVNSRPSHPEDMGLPIRGGGAGAGGLGGGHASRHGTGPPPLRPRVAPITTLTLDL
jgi:hypothetical protein